MVRRARGAGHDHAGGRRGRARGAPRASAEHQRHHVGARRSQRGAAPCALGISNVPLSFKLVRPRGLPQKRQQMDRKKKQKRNEQRLEIELPDLKERLKLDRELDQDTRKVIENA